VTKRYAFRAPRAAPPQKVPRIARLLALAHKFQKMLDSGEVESMSELARLGRVSRARITQIMDLMMLAPEIQDEVLFGAVDIPFRESLSVVRHLAWRDQRNACHAIRELRRPAV
jgi:hypothetical protein